MTKKIITLMMVASIGLIGLNSCNKETKCSNTCEEAIPSYYTSTVTPEGTRGDYKLTYTAVQAGGAFSDGDKINVTVKEDQLVVKFGSKCISVGNPYNPYGPGITEASFKDNCEFDVIFAVSENSDGDFNEINISDLNGMFLGQFKE